MKKKDGSWSVQQPHGLTALRSVLAIYNATADALHSWLQIPGSLALTKPDDIEFPKATSPSAVPVTRKVDTTGHVS